MTSAQATAIAGVARGSAGPLGDSLGVTSEAGIDIRGPYVEVQIVASYQPVAGQFIGVRNVPVGASSRLYLP